MNFKLTLADSFQIYCGGVQAKMIKNYFGAHIIMDLSVKIVI